MRSYTVEVEAPSQGHFWALGPLPIDAPPVLHGPSGVRAYRLEELGDHSAIYGIESLGEFIEPGPLTLSEPAAESPIPDFWLHPWIADDPMALVAHASLGRSEAKASALLVQDGPLRKRFAVTYEADRHIAMIWLDVYARSPVVQASGFIAATDRMPGRVDVRLEFGEEVVMQSAQHGHRLKADGSVISGVAELDRAAIYPIRFSLLCRGVTSGGTDELDDLSEAALNAAADGPRWFIPREWSGEWLGVQPAVDSAAGQHYAGAALSDYTLASRMYEQRPFASMPKASQGGAQPGLGLTWYAPVFVPIRFRPHDVHLWCAEDWALRPMHLFTPGTAWPLVDVRRYGATVSSRQIHELSEIDGQMVPKFQTHGTIPTVEGAGSPYTRSTNDELHAADGPLCAAYALTGDPVCGWIIRSIVELELAQRSMSSGWRSNGRGEGRMGTWLLNMGKLLGGDIQRRTQEHMRARLEVAVEKSSTAQLPVTAPSRPIQLYRDNRLKCQHPAQITYEESQIAWMCWRLYQETGSAAALASAYRWGVTVACQLYRTGGRWALPYASFQRADGSPLTMAELTNPAMVHPSNFPLHWSGAGLRALLHAVETKPDLLQPGHAEFVERARSAVEEMAAAPSFKIEEIHQGLHSVPVATAPVE